MRVSSQLYAKRSILHNELTREYVGYMCVAHKTPGLYPSTEIACELITPATLGTALPLEATPLTRH